MEDGGYFELKDFHIALKAPERQAWRWGQDRSEPLIFLIVGVQTRFDLGRLTDSVPTPLEGRISVLP